MPTTRPEAALAAAGRGGVLVLLAVLLSGGGGLVYQVAWTRRLASVTSATATAQAVVLAVFMAGLGAGALLAGSRARRMRRPLVAYAAVEASAAVLALLSRPLIDGSDAVRAGLMARGVTGAGALWLQLTAVMGYLLLPATLLGASLPFVVEHASRGVLSRALTGRRVGWLYAVNTAGAAAGCLLAGFVTVEILGLSRTVAVGAALSGAAALVGAVVGRAIPIGPPAAEGPIASGERLEGRFLAASALAGFVGLATEVLWTRLIALVTFSTVYALAQVLAAVLAGIALGGVVAVLLVRMASEEGFVAHGRRLLSLTQSLAAVLLSVVPVALMWLSQWGMLAELSAARGLRGFAALLLLLVPPAALGAAVLPLLVAFSTSGESSRAFGMLFAANTAGGVAGSLMAGFVLLPAAGSWGTWLSTVAGSLLLAALLLPRQDPRRARTALALSAVGCAALVLPTDIPLRIYESWLPQEVQILDFREGYESDVMVTDDPEGVRQMWINATWVAVSGKHRFQGHLPGLLVAKPRNVCGIALGTGQTFSAILKHGVERLTCVEIDAGVIALSRRWFSHVNEGLLDRPNVRVVHGDGRAFLRSTAERFDVIVLEPLQAWSAGTAGLYSRGFYEDARRVLAPHGVVAQWIPFYGQGPDETKSMVRSGLEIFPNASLWLDNLEGMLLLHDDPLTIDVEALMARVRERGLERQMAEESYGDPTDFLSLFLFGPEGMKRWVDGAPVLEDDRPFLEFAAARQIGSNLSRDIVRSTVPFVDDPARYMPHAGPEALALAARAAVVRSAMLDQAAFVVDDLPRRAVALEAGLAQAPESLLLRTRYRWVILRWGRALPTAQAVPLYARGIAHDPGLPEYALQVARLYAGQGRLEQARASLEQALMMEPVKVQAQELLDSLPSPPEPRS